jgi:hypothetical protein
MPVILATQETEMLTRDKHNDVEILNIVVLKMIYRASSNQKNADFSWAWWHIAVILALQRQRGMGISSSRPPWGT